MTQISETELAPTSTYLAWTIASFYFELSNAVSLTRFVIIAVVNTACQALTIRVQTVVPIFVLGNILKTIKNVYVNYNIS